MDKFKLLPHVLLESGDQEYDEAVLIDGHTGRMWSCNSSANLLIEFIKDGACHTELADMIVSHYGVHTHMALRDTRRFVDLLQSIGAVEVINVTSRSAASSSITSGSTAAPLTIS